MSNVAVEITYNGQGEVIAIKLDGTSYSPVALLLMVQRVRELEAKVKRMSLPEQYPYKQTGI